jgi:hypothetical protein
MIEDDQKQNVAVSVLEFESAQAAIGLGEWFEKLDVARRELCRQRVRIGDMEVGVPAGYALLDVSRVVRHRIDADVLEQIIAVPRWTMPKKMSSGSGP